MNSDLLLEIIGITGGLLCLTAFIEVSLGKWNGQSFRYEIYNLLSCIFLGYYAFQKEAYTNIVLNLVWGGVALFVIAHIITRHGIRSGSLQQVAIKKTKR